MREYEIFYGPHWFAKDIEGLKTSLMQADIFLPECTGWLSTHLAIYNTVSEGLLTPLAAVRRFAVGTSHLTLPEDAAIGFFNLIYKSHKPIAFIDIPQNHPITARFVANGTQGFRLGKKFSETLQYAENHLREIAAIDTGRENHEAAHLEPTVDSILKLNSALAKRDPLRILLFKGAGHLRLSSLLETSGKTVRQTFAYEPMVYPFQNEVVQRFVLGKNVDRVLMARAVMEMVVFLPTVLKVVKSTRPALEYCRKALARFSFQEIEHAFQEARTTGSYNTLTALMKRKGIPHPNSEQDIFAFLQS